MLGRDDDVHTPPPASLSDAPARLTEFAFALGDPQRTALLACLVEERTPRTADELAAQMQISSDETREHLRVLVDAGLVATKRQGLKRTRIYVSTVADLELRFFSGERSKRDRARTARLLQRDARRRERQKRRLERKERRIAKEARRN